MNTLMGAELLRAAGGVASQRGDYTVASYLERGYYRHMKPDCQCTGGCACEIEARRYLEMP